MTSRPDSRRVGGEFELISEDLQFETIRRSRLPTFGAAHEAWLDTGRSALAVISAHLARTSPNSTVWLPAFGCESIVAPFLRRGLRTRFYPVGAQLDRIDADPAAGDTLLFIHYFGLRNETALRRVGDFRAARVRIIEDCAQAALTTGIGLHGDHALTSLRKLLAQPDGALLASRETLALEIDAADEEFISARIAAKLLRGAMAPRPAFLPLIEGSERRLAADHPRAMSWISRQLLARSDLEGIAARRRANFSALRDGLAGCASPLDVRPFLPALQEGEVPLGCPVLLDPARRDAVRRHLAERDIYCPIHWDLSHVADRAFADEHALSASLLTLPIDQRYDNRDMFNIVDSVATFFGDHP